MPGIDMQRTLRIKAMHGTGIRDQLNRMAVLGNGIAPALASRQRRPVVRGADQDQRVRQQVGSGRLAAGIERHRRGERVSDVDAGIAGQHDLEYGPPTVRETDDADAARPHVGRTTQPAGGMATR